MSIKQDPELRHVLAHFHNAIEALIRGEPKTARYELESVEGLYLFDSDEEMDGYINQIKEP